MPPFIGSIDDDNGKNPEQTLVLEDDKTGAITFTLDDIAGAISYREGHIALVLWQTALNDDNRSNALRRARAAFQKATRFCPDRASYYVNLAEACKLLSDKPAALEAIAVALKLNPGDAEAIKINGEIAQLPDPALQAALREKKSHPILYSFLAGVVCFIVVLILTPYGRSVGGPVPDGALVLLLIVGLVLCAGPLLLKFLAWKDYNEYRQRRARQDARRMVRDTYEEKYQADMERRYD